MASTELLTNHAHGCNFARTHRAAGAHLALVAGLVEVGLWHEHQALDGHKHLQRGACVHRLKAAPSAPSCPHLLKT